MREKIFITLFTTFLIFICVFFSNEMIIEYGYIFYGIQLLSIIFILIKIKNNYIFFFSPSFITICYLNISYFFGHFVVTRGLGFDLKYYSASLGYLSFSFITGFLLLCNLMVFLSLPFDKFKKSTFQKDDSVRHDVSHIVVMTLLCVLLVLGFVNIDLSILGGSGDFSYVFQLSLVIIIVFLLSKYKGKAKYLYYLALLFFFIVGNYDSKREILYVLILILFVEFVKRSGTIKIRLRQFIIGLAGLAIFFYIIIVSSIMRGYGNFNTSDPIEASGYVFTYVQSDYASNALLANFELSSVYGNTSNAINYVYEDEVDLLFGSTFLKVLFIPFPRSIFPDKPSSMIDVYTNKFAPDFRGIGGSYPVGIYAESFWNFYLFALPFIFIVFRIFNMFFLKVIYITKKSFLSPYNVFLIYMYITIIQFVRGSGFEIWFIYGVLSIPFTWIVLNIFKLNSYELKLIKNDQKYQYDKNNNSI